MHASAKVPNIERVLGLSRRVRRDRHAAPDELDGTRRANADGAEILRANRHAHILYRSDGDLVALFTSDFMLDRFQRLHPDVTLDRMRPPTLWRSRPHS